MSNKPSSFSTAAWRRSLSASYAGAKAGHKWAIKNALASFASKDKQAELKRLALADQAHAFVDELGRLKGGYVKIGQTLATIGSDILPREVVSALRILESQAEPLPWEEIEPHLKRSLGSKFGGLNIEQAPVFAASLSQVYAAQNDDLERLAVKVQYPGVAKAMKADLDHVVTFLKLMPWAPSGNVLNALVTSLRQQLLDEVDYTREVEMLSIIRAKLAGDSRFVVPLVYPDLSGKQVICMQWLEAEDVASEAVQNLSLSERNALAESMLDLLFKEIFVWGYYQSDPNFGNYKVSLAGPRPQIALLDFGSIQRFDADFQKHLQNVIAACRYRQSLELIQALTHLGFSDDSMPGSVKSSFAELCFTLMEPLAINLQKNAQQYLNDKGEYCWADSDLIKRSSKLAAQSALSPHFKAPPPEFTILIRKLAGVFSFITALRAEFNAGDLLQSYIEKAIYE